MTRLVKVLLITIAIWVVATLSIYLLPHPFPGVRGLGFLLVPFFGALLASFSIVLIIFQESKIVPLLAILFIALFSVGVFYKADSWGIRFHFFLFKSRYEAMAAQIAATKDTEEMKKICSNNRCYFGPGIRFPYSTFFFVVKDIVYDPSSEVNTKDVEKLRSLSIYLRRTEPLSGSWYMCVFMD
jgi:hypothetical protein